MRFLDYAGGTSLSPPSRRDSRATPAASVGRTVPVQQNLTGCRRTPTPRPVTDYMVGVVAAAVQADLLRGRQ
jgi:hypothetical protein